MPPAAEVVCFHLHQSALTTWATIVQLARFGNKIVVTRRKWQLAIRAGDYVGAGQEARYIGGIQ
jgi:hypothetical protein